MPSNTESETFEPTSEVLDDSAPLVSYARAQGEPIHKATPGPEIPVLRNNPFGESLGGGETPFFVGMGGEGVPLTDDDGHEGVPTGLPAALGRLDEVELAADASGDQGATAPLAERLEERDVQRSARAAPPQRPTPATGSELPPVGWVVGATLVGFGAGWMASMLLMPMLGG